jgi:hypothetical protein
MANASSSSTFSCLKVYHSYPLLLLLPIPSF